MNQYVTGTMIKRLRESQGMTQQELAEKRRQAAEELAKDSKYIDSDDNTINIYANLPEEEKERLRRFMDKFRGQADRNPKL